MKHVCKHFSAVVLSVFATVFACHAQQDDDQVPIDYLSHASPKSAQMAPRGHRNGQAHTNGIPDIDSLANFNNHSKHNASIKRQCANHLVLQHGWSRARASWHHNVQCSDRPCRAGLAQRRWLAEICKWSPANIQPGKVCPADTRFAALSELHLLEQRCAYPVHGCGPAGGVL
jgi:hypothetical protein